MSTKEKDHDEKHAEKHQGKKTAPANVALGVQEQIKHGGPPADDPRRNPAPETVSAEDQAEQLRKDDRERHDKQGDKG